MLHDTCYDQRNHGESREGDSDIFDASRNERKNTFRGHFKLSRAVCQIKCIVAPQSVTVGYPADGFVLG